MTARKPGNREGFSVVEILIALTIFLIAVLGIGRLTFYTVKAGRINELKEEAIYSAERVLNHLISLSYTNSCLTESNCTPLCENRNCVNENCCNDSLCEDWEFRITYSVNSSSTGIKKITVNATFKVGNTFHSIKLEQLKGDWQ